MIARAAMLAGLAVAMSACTTVEGPAPEPYVFRPAMPTATAERPAPERVDSTRDRRAYFTCLAAAGDAFTVSSEPVETVVSAAMGFCLSEERRYVEAAFGFLPLPEIEVMRRRVRETAAQSLTSRVMLNRGRPARSAQPQPATPSVDI